MAVLERGGPGWITPSSVRESLVSIAVIIALAALVALP